MNILFCEKQQSRGAPSTDISSCKTPYSLIYKSKHSTIEQLLLIDQQGIQILHELWRRAKIYKLGGTTAFLPL